MKKILILLALASSMGAFGQKYNNLALTPPMGWNSWNTFNCDINEKLIRQIADVMVSSGMKDAGYQFVNMDDELYVTENPHVLNGLTWGGVRWAFTTSRATHWLPRVLPKARH